ncbi:MAG: carboxypeptidase-like regulatory domain-containing protein, partial [Pseudomonadota bacterium]
MIGRQAALLVGLAGGLLTSVRAFPAPSDAGSDARDAAVDAPLLIAAPDGGTPDGAARTSDAAAPAVALPPPVVALRLGGRVLEKGTRNPIAGASIVIDTAVAGQTDADGRFELSVPAGEHAVAVQIAGRQILAHTVTVSAERAGDDL